MTDGGTKAGSGSAGGKGASGFVTVATGGAGIGVADGEASTTQTPEVPTESGMHTRYGARFGARFGARYGAGFGARYGAGFGDGAEFTNDSRVNDATRH